MTPRAASERLELRDGVLRVYVCSAPVDGGANKAVIRLVAKALKVPKSTVSIKRGESARDKVLLVSTLSSAELAERLSAI